jgi:tetratricopeptide (TPR) repeat protein
MNRSILGCILAAALTLSAGCAATGPENAPVAGGGDIQRLVASVQKAVVTIQTFDQSMQPTGLGTGFFVDPRGHLVTNYHVMDGAFSAVVKTEGGETYPVELVLADNKSVDLVKVSVDIPPESVRWIEVTGEEPAVADRIVVVGSPLGLEQTVSEGIVSAVRELPDSGKIFQMSAPISRGSSGSPVIDRSGRVIGVVSFQSMSGQNINFAVAGQGVVELEDAENPVALGEWTYRKSRGNPKLAQSLCRSGYQFSIRGEYKEALAYYREATETEPGNSEAWYGLGNCYVGLERTEDAIDAYRQVIRTAPEDPFAHYNLGRYYLELGEFGKAVGVFREAAAVDPKYIPALFDMAVALGRLGQHREEIDAYGRVIEVNPDFFPAHHQMGIAYHRAGQYTEALRAQQRVLALSPDFVPAHLAIGLIWHDLDDPQKARAHYTDALRIDPDFAPAHYQMAVLYLDAGDRSRALQEYKILKRLDPEMADRLFDRIYR